MKGPANPARSNVVRANVAGCRSFALSNASTLNEKVLMDDARARRDEKRIVDITSEPEPQINEPRVAERVNRTPGARVERIETPAGGEEECVGRDRQPRRQHPG